MAERPDRNVAHRRFVSYIDKSREYYAAQGYDEAYRWAAFDTVPFASLTKPLAECNIAAITTSFPSRAESHFGAPAVGKQVYAMAVADVPEQMFTHDLSWHKTATHTDDIGTFLPLERLEEFAADGRIGSLNHRFFGVPTEHSQRKTGLDAEQIERWCVDDGVDAAVLVPL